MLPEQRCDRNKDLVTRLMPESIIERLEVIGEVDLAPNRPQPD